MHVITVAFGEAPAMWQFVFKTEEAATAAWQQLGNDTQVVIVDDFGQTGNFDSKHINGRMLENLDVSKQAHIARSLHQQRIQAEFQKAAESDPVIRTAMRGPAVLSPMGNSFNGRGN